MAVTVVLSYPRRRHFLRRARRGLETAFGYTLFVLGLLSSTVAFSATMLVFLYIVASSNSPEPGSSSESSNKLWSGVGIREVLIVWAVSVLITIVGVRMGLRLLHEGRRLVLFLRRFGFEDATKAVTFAATKTVGRSWRLVTLDDHAIAPLGVPTGTRRLYGAGTALALGAEKIPGLVKLLCKRVLPTTAVAMAAVLGLQLLRAPDRHAALHDGTFDPYGQTVESLLRLHIPVGAIGLSLLGAFTLLAILLFLIVGAAFGFVLISIPAALLMLTLFPTIHFLRLSADRVRDAERGKTHAIHVKKEIGTVVWSISSGSRKVFAPRLVVVRVAAPVWRQTVEGFAEVCAAPLIDLSDVSENVLWELDELTRRFGSRCLLVGRNDRVAWLAHPPAATPGSDEERLLRLLDGYEVLAYTTDRRGTRRFARSLRTRLLAAAG